MITKNNINLIRSLSFKKNRERLNLYDSVKESFNNIFIISIKTLIAFKEILFGQRDHCEVGGPILIAKVSTDIVNTDYVSFMALIALISINLGLINLFPLPLLDGGHLLTYISEFVSGKDINYNLFNDKSKQIIEKLFDRADKINSSDIVKEDYSKSINHLIAILSEREHKDELLIKEGLTVKKFQNEVDLEKYVIELGGKFWSKVLEYGSQRTLFSQSEGNLFDSGYKIITSTNPASIFYSDYLLDMLPNAYFTFVQRDPRDISPEIFTSEYNMENFYSYDVNEIKKYLDVYYQVFETLVSKVPKRCLSVSFKDIVQAPGDVVARISRLIGTSLGMGDFKQNVANFEYESIFRNHYAALSN